MNCSVLVSLFCAQSLLPTMTRLVIGDSSADRVKENGGAEPLFSVEVPTEQVRPGDRVLVLPGESLPVDVSPVVFPASPSCRYALPCGQNKSVSVYNLRGTLLH